MKINFFYENVAKPKIKLSKIRLWISEIAKLYDKSIGEINYIFCDNKYIIKINQEYLNHNYNTDIITFDYSENKKLKADLFISLETVTLNAKKYNTEDTEIYRVIIHGILHIMGINDKTPEEFKNMKQAEDNALSLIHNY